MSFIYTDFANGLWDPTANVLGRVDLLSDTIKLAMIDITLYVADRDADVSLDDIAGSAIVAAETVTGLTVITRAITSDPIVFPLMTGAECAAAVLYKHTGTASTSPLIAYLDTFDSGMPVDPDGTNFTMNPPAGGFIQL